MPSAPIQLSRLHNSGIFKFILKWSHLIHCSSYRAPRLIFSSKPTRLCSRFDCHKARPQRRTRNSREIESGRMWRILCSSASPALSQINTPPSSSSTNLFFHKHNTSSIYLRRQPQPFCSKLPSSLHPYINTYPRANSQPSTNLHPKSAPTPRCLPRSPKPKRQRSPPPPRLKRLSILNQSWCGLFSASCPRKARLPASTGRKSRVRSRQQPAMLLGKSLVSFLSLLHNKWMLKPCWSWHT